MQFISLENFRFSDKLNNINDAVPGGSTAGGTGASLYGGLLGKRIWLDNTQAAALSNATQTLYAGIYQYVVVLSTATAAPALGQVCFWKPASFTATDGTQYTVTSDGSVTVGDGMWAGIFLGAPSKGFGCWIQVAGLATCLCKAVVTNATQGNLAVVTTGNNTVDAVADGTSVTGGGAAGAKNVIGVWQQAPVNGALKIAALRPTFYF